MMMKPNHPILLLNIVITVLGPLCGVTASVNAQGQYPTELVEQGDSRFGPNDLTTGQAAYPATMLPQAACNAQNQQGVDAYQLGHYDEALAALEAALLCYRETKDGAGEGQAFNNIAAVHLAQGRYPEALDNFRQALTIRQALGDRIGEGQTLNNMGAVYVELGRYDEALDHFQRALIIRREVEDRIGEGRTLNNIGGIYHDTGRYAQALEYYLQALAIARETQNRNGEATALQNIGLVYHDLGDYDRALAEYQVALEIVQEIGNRDGEGRILGNIGSAHNAKGRFDQALDHYEQALAIFREVGDPVAEADILNNMGTVYESQGLYEKALADYQAALKISTGLLDVVGAAQTRTNIAGVYVGQGRYSQAVEEYQQVLKVFQAVDDLESQGDTLNDLGIAQAQQGAYDDALATHHAALVIRRQIGDRAGEGATLNNIATVYLGQARYGQALEYLQAAQAIDQAIQDHHGEARTLHNIAAVYDRQGRYEQALATYQAALKILQTVGDRAGEGSTLQNIAGVYVSQERDGEALTHYEQALQILRAVGADISQANALLGIGATHQRQARYTEALTSFQQALKIYRTAGSRAGEGTSLNNIGSVYTAQEQYTEALAQYQQALTIHRSIGDRSGEGVTLSNIAVVYDRQGNFSKALSHYQQAIQVVEAVRGIAGSEAGRTSVVNPHTWLYDRAIQLAVQQNQISVAFFISEQGRARAFLDSLATGQVDLFDDAAAELLKREQEGYAARQAARDELARARALRPPDPTLVATLAEQVAALEQDYTTTLRAIAARTDQLADLVPMRKRVLALDEVQALLDPQTTLISYRMMADHTLAFVVTAATIHAVELSDATPENLYRTLSDLHRWLNREHPHPQSLQQLHRWLIGPLADHISTPHVAIVPHFLLHYIPFAALTDGATYFGQQHTLSILPSASALPFLRQNAGGAPATPNGSALILGNPQTALSTLPAAEAESKAVAALLMTTVYTGAAASEVLLRDQVADAHIVHLATHGQYNTDNPLYSALHLAGEANDAPGEENGLLETHEIFALPLQHNEIVVLSACETNLNQFSNANQIPISAGDELVGLTRAFFFAGAPTVIASLWQVDDDASAALMLAFYHNWQAEGMSKAEALQAAQAEVRADPRWASPFYWAGFVLNGHAGATR
jgi:tetratricopeptide (TPR) repeat protein